MRVRVQGMVQESADISGTESNLETKLQSNHDNLNALTVTKESLSVANKYLQQDINNLKNESAVFQVLAKNLDLLK